MTRLTIVGIGADGWAGLTERAREAIRAAPLLVGSARQLDLIPPHPAPADPPAPAATSQRRLPWPSPLDPLVTELARGDHGDACVLASGDPMLHGIGATFARRTDPANLDVIPHPSAFALACARLGWPAAETDLLSAVAREPALVARALQPGRRLIVYVTGADGAARLARVVTEAGWGPSRFVVLERLGAGDSGGERVHDTTAAAWGDRPADPLHAVAIEPRPAPGIRPHPSTPGLPDDAFDHDGQLTKRHVRAVTLAALAPLPGELLWDVGAGSGSIAIEWLRAAPRTRAIAVESNAERARRIERNARALGVPEALTLAHARAPEALATLREPPDAVFVGGGVTAPGLLDACWEALRPGGRIVVNAVTLESQARLLDARAAHGGTLTQIAIAHAAAVGGFTGWRAQMPVVQWESRKEEPA